MIQNHSKISYKFIHKHVGGRREDSCTRAETRRFTDITEKCVHLQKSRRIVVATSNISVKCQDWLHLDFYSSIIGFSWRKYVSEHNIWHSSKFCHTDCVTKNNPQFYCWCYRLQLCYRSVMIRHLIEQEILLAFKCILGRHIISWSEPDFDTHKCGHKWRRIIS